MSYQLKTDNQGYHIMHVETDQCAGFLRPLKQGCFSLHRALVLANEREHLQGGSRNRQVADRAINSGIAKLDFGNFHDAIARCDPSFDHLYRPLEAETRPYRADHLNQVAGAISPLSSSHRAAEVG
jgi:hypothetical protein